MNIKFNRNLILNEKENEVKIVNLCKSIEYDEMSNFGDWDWLINVFKEIMEYKQDGFEKPCKLLNDLCALSKVFPYTGPIYRGYVLDGLSDIPDLKDSNVCSWSIDRDVAFRFTENAEDFWCVLESNANNLFSLSDFMATLLEICPHDDVVEYFDIYLGEDEVLAPVEGYTVQEKGYRCIE